jgi:hypothetical protein
MELSRNILRESFDMTWPLFSLRASKAFPSGGTHAFWSRSCATMNFIHTSLPEHPWQRHHTALGYSGMYLVRPKRMLNEWGLQKN